MDIDILTLFPSFFEGPFSTTMVGRALSKGLATVNVSDIRDYAEDKHKSVDDAPYGGGPGMVLKPGPLVRAIQSVRRDDSYVIYLSPQGKTLNSTICEELSQNHKHIVLICGHYEGIDERVVDLEVDAEISIGDYVMTHGGPAAVVLVDSVLRFVPGVLGHDNSAYEDSFHIDSIFDTPKYTRPKTYQGMDVPEVLLNGHHEKIRMWGEEQVLKKLKKNRPDLIRE